MQMFGGILLVAILFTVVALGSQYWRTAEDLDTSRRTAEGFLTLIEGLYAYRADNVSQWPTSFSNLTPYLPLLRIDAVDPMQAGANGDGGRYTLRSQAVTSRSQPPSARSHTLKQSFASLDLTATYAPVSSGFQITVAVPAPGGITLMQQTLLTDGTNKMHRPLWLQNTVSAGASCTTTGMAVNATGDLMKCDGGVWQPH